MKANPNPRIKHVLKSGIVVEDISTVIIPKGHPVYAFLARIDRMFEEEEETNESANVV